MTTPYNFEQPWELPVKGELEWREEMISTPRIYLAARYSRREELNGYKQQIEKAGYVVNARWLTGTHEKSGNDQKWATEDYLDVVNADIFILFGEPPDFGYSRGGRFVELGMAIGHDLRCIVIGYRENVFCHLPKIEFYATWEECLAQLRKER